MRGRLGNSSAQNGEAFIHKSAASLPLSCAGPETSRSRHGRASWATLAGTAGALECCPGRSPTWSEVRTPCTSCMHPFLGLWLGQDYRHHSKGRPPRLQQRVDDHLSEAKTVSSSSSHCGCTASKFPTISSLQLDNSKDTRRHMFWYMTAGHIKVLPLIRCMHLVTSLIKEFGPWPCPSNRTHST